MQMPTRIVLIIALALALATGCGTEQDVCQDAALHLQQCLGQDDINVPSTCDLDRASDVLTMSCTQIQVALESGKSDSWLGNFFKSWLDSDEEKEPCDDDLCDEENKKENDQQEKDENPFFKKW